MMYLYHCKKEARGSTRFTSVLSVFCRLTVAPSRGRGLKRLRIKESQIMRSHPFTGRGLKRKGSLPCVECWGRPFTKLAQNTTY